MPSFYAPDIGSFTLSDALAADTDQLPDGAVAIPDKPDGEWVWDPETVDWVANPEALALWRAQATLSRTQFCLGVWQGGILSEQEAIEAARGEWPSTFAAALAGEPQEYQTAAMITWAGITEIPRTHELLERVRAASAITPEQLDTVFGWVG